MWIFLIIIAFLALKMYSERASVTGAPSLGRNNFTPVSSTADTVGDNFGSGCAFTAGVPEPSTPLVCSGVSVPPTCHPILAHFPIDPPPIAIQQPASRPILCGIPIRPAPHCNVAPVVQSKPPLQIFPVPVGFHNPVPSPTTTISINGAPSTVRAVQPTAPVLLRQSTGAVQLPVNPWPAGSYQAYMWQRMQAGLRVSGRAVVTSSGGVSEKYTPVYLGKHIGGTCGACFSDLGGSGT